MPPRQAGGFHVVQRDGEREKERERERYVGEEKEERERERERERVGHPDRGARKFSKGTVRSSGSLLPYRSSRGNITRLILPGLDGRGIEQGRERERGRKRDEAGNRGNEKRVRRGRATSGGRTHPLPRRCRRCRRGWLAGWLAGWLTRRSFAVANYGGYVGVWPEHVRARRGRQTPRDRSRPRYTYTP